MPARPHVLPRFGGDPAANGREVQRALDGMRTDVSRLTAEDIAFEATPADWVAPVPTNLHQAITRLAAAGGTHPVP